METHREVPLPVDLKTARQRLTAAFASPLVVQQGNFILAKIVCSGRIKENELWVQYTEYGRSITRIALTGYLEETAGGVRLHMTISSDEAFKFLVYLPLAAVILFVALDTMHTGFKAQLLPKYFILLIFSGLIFLIRSLGSSFHQLRITRIEEVLVQIITG